MYINVMHNGLYKNRKIYSGSNNKYTVVLEPTLCVCVCVCVNIRADDTNGGNLWTLLPRLYEVTKTIDGFPGVGVRFIAG